VRNLVADSLELVCPSKRRPVREARESSSFDFDRSTGEWTGLFGSFGEFAVMDSKPAAIPTNNREEVESTLSHNAAQFADCTLDEQPPPKEGDDEFGVSFVEQDDTGLTFEITGIDSETEAALTFCFLEDGSCALADANGMRVDSRGIETDSIRPNVVRIHIGVDEEESTRTGQWTLALDLGDGRSTRVTFEVR
jgi:hypothetical protein